MNYELCESQTGVMSHIKTLRGLQKALKTAKQEEQVVSLLDQNATLLDGDGGVELLAWAVQHKRPHVVKALVQRGVDIEAARVRDKTVLQWAVEARHEKMARLLLEQGANITNKGRCGDTPLMLALTSVDMKLVKLLLEHMGGQRLEEKDNNHKTALAIAASRGLQEVVSLLLDQGADARMRDNWNMTPFMLAARRGDADGFTVVKLLLKHLQAQDIDARDTQGRTALHWACIPNVSIATASGCEGIVRTLLLAGANPTITDNYGNTARGFWSSDAGVRAVLMAALKWWEREPERRFLLHKARCLSNVCSPVACLEARVGAGQELPCVEVASQEGGNGKRKRVAREEQGQEKERHAVVEYVVEGLSEELFTELMQGLYLDHTY